MAISEQDREAFKEFEKTGWNRQAEHYDKFAGQMTRRTVDALLDAVNARSGAKLLDVATGPGYVAANAVRRGADAIGIDLSSAMLEEARQRFPDVKFEAGDAENLGYSQGSFDSVVCAFGMLHFPRPGRALAEAYRVLKPGGHCAFAVWSAPARTKLLTLVAEAVQSHADPSVTLPVGPSLFMLSDPWTGAALMEAATFIDVQAEEVPSFFAASSPSDVFEFMRKSMVRATYVYDRQSPDAQRRIEQAIKASAAEALAIGKGRIPCPALLVRGTKATA